MNRPAYKPGEHLRIALFCANFKGVPDGASRALNRLVRYRLDRGAAVRVYSAAVADPPVRSDVAHALLVDESSALLVAPEDPRAYADAVEDLIRAPSLQAALGKAALATSSAYDWDEVLGPVLDLYETIR